ncbi:MAG: methyltransferase domain-containing protein [bacterium]|nr:methyltransferase domain-containing protein [bacterium]
MRLRYFFARGKLRTLNAAGAFQRTVNHNLSSLYSSSNRNLKLFRPLSVIETLPPHSKVLIIGPRSEYDLFLLHSCGFEWDNIEGLDLISYSEKIRLGDMHAMQYPANSWDAVVLGWTLSYSHKPQQVADEIIRVTKGGGLVGVAVEYCTLNEQEQIERFGYSIQDWKLLPERINTVDQILALFDKNIDTVFFRHDSPNKISSGSDTRAEPSYSGVIFSIRK